MLISKSDRKKYVLKTKQDERILEKTKRLGRLARTQPEKKLVRFLKTQLEEDWRTPLEKFVDAALLRTRKKRV